MPLVRASPGVEDKRGDRASGQEVPTLWQQGQSHSGPFFQRPGEAARSADLGERSLTRPRGVADRGRTQGRWG